MKKHLFIKVHGRVQGISFRQRTKEIANKLGLTGTVENMPDGSVEIHAEGQDKSLRELLSWCRQGTELAGVENIEYEEYKPEGYESFRII